jgi:phage portal protein BeeE
MPKFNVFKAFLGNREGKKTIFDPFGDTNARWYTLKENEDYAKAYQEVPELNAIITSKSKQFAKGIWKCKNIKTGEQIEEDKFLSVLKNPNPLMSANEFLQSLYIDKEVFGNAFQFFLTPGGQKPTIDNVKYIYNLDARYTYPQTTGKIFYQLKLSDIIEKYVFEVKGQSYDFKTDLVCHIANNNIDFLNGQYAVGESPLKSLNWALSNIKAAYEARNVYITRRGAFGVLSNNSKGDMGIQPIEDKDDLQKQLNRYGLTKKQWQFIITNADVKWNPISIPTKDLELYKEVKESVIAIANQYNYPILLLNYMEGSTFSNMGVETRRLYTDSIIPDSKHITEEINRSVGAYENNKEYYLSYDHVESIQTDKKTEAERHKIAVDTILALNEAIRNGNMTYEAAVNTLVTIAEIEESNAELLIDRYENEINSQTNTGTQEE